MHVYIVGFFLLVLMLLLLLSLSEADEVYIQCDPGLFLAFSFKLNVDLTNKTK
jgi:hypothetical protein